MTISESFNGAVGSQNRLTQRKKTSRKTKIALKYIARTENHGHKKVALIPCQILALIHHVEYANIDAEAKA